MYISIRLRGGIVSDAMGGGVGGSWGLSIGEREGGIGRGKGGGEGSLTILGGGRAEGRGRAVGSYGGGLNLDGRGGVKAGAVGEVAVVTRRAPGGVGEVDLWTRSTSATSQYP